VNTKKTGASGRVGRPGAALRTRTEDEPGSASAPERPWARSHAAPKPPTLAASDPRAKRRCKETRSCQLLLPAEAAGRKSDVYMVAGSSGLKLAPEGRWVVCVSGRVEGATDGLSALQVAKRELASVLPLLKPASKLFAELSDVCEAADDGEASRLFVPSSCDETSHMASTAADVDAILQRITGEGLDVN